MEQIANNSKIDEALYSRQLYVLDHASMGKLQNSTILLVGLGGLGLEIAKCIILSGPKRVIIHDTQLTRLEDLTTQYYLTEQDIGKSRLVCVEKLKGLNPYVQINVVSDANIETTINKYAKELNVVILTETMWGSTIRINQITRANNIKLISCKTFGAFGYTFNDFLDSHIITDFDGEEIKTGLVKTINTNSDYLTVETIEPSELSNGDVIKFDTGFGTGSELSGTVRNIKSNLSFDIMPDAKIDLGLDFSQITTWEQVKIPTQARFTNFLDMVSNPILLGTNSIDVSRGIILHKFTQALNEFVDYFKREPDTYNESDANLIVKRTRELAGPKLSYSDDLIRKLSYTLKGRIASFDAVIGSVVAQEAIKGLTGKFTPINNIAYWDITNLISLTKPETRIVDRYISQRILFGDKFQEKLANSTVFIVGSGAIGCEHLKNWAMMGIGNIIITDMDTIEKSNLNRQFLFSNTDIGESKSKTAAREIKKINPLINITAHIDKVCKETEHIYSSEFFSKIDCVTNALDNKEARLYVDTQCVIHGKPLLESGTLGTKCNVQVVIPHLTESYGKSADPAEKSIPLCTLKSFPYLMTHCVQYSMDTFEEYFNQNPKKITSYLENPEINIDDIKDKLWLYAKDRENYEELAINIFNKLFDENIRDLQDKYPSGHIEDGKLFWSGTKKYPVSIKFDNSNELHRTFVKATSKLFKDICFGSELLKSIVFEKDDDTNEHINFVCAISNLRAINYGIKQESAHNIKKIAGKIIPAIATSTSHVSGLVGLELYKVLSGFKTINSYSNSFCNLAIGLFVNTEPVRVDMITNNTNQYTEWDFETFKDPTLQELINHYMEKYGCEIDDVSYGSYILYSSIISSHETRLESNVIKLVSDVAGIDKTGDVIVLNVVGDGEHELPMAKIYG